MILQQKIFIEELDCEKENLLVYQGGSHASRTALQDCVKRLVMNVINGRKCGELLEILALNGSWLKMYGVYCQVKMDGSLEESSGTLPKWGMMLDGELRALPDLEPFIDEKEWLLLPTPVATDYKGGALRKNSKKQMSNLKEHIYIFFKDAMKSIYLHPRFLENMMGFPTGWTELNASETP